MTRYRGLKDGVKYNTKSGYLSKKDLYRIIQKYRRLYRSLKYPRPRYRGKSSGRTSKSLSKYRPRQQSTRNPAPKYKKMPKPNLSSPLRERPIRYSHQSHFSRTEIDAEQLANEIQSKLDNKLTKLLLEKLEAEIQELQKIESDKIDANTEMSEAEETQNLSELLERSGEEQGMSIEGPFEMDDESFDELVKRLKEARAEQAADSQVEETETEELESETKQETIEEQVENTQEIERESQRKNETETDQEFEEREETREKADQIEGHIIDEEWIDEDGLNTFFWSETEPEQIEQEEVSDEPLEPEIADVVETEVSEAELFLPEIELLEPEPLDEIIEPEEAGI